MYNIAVFASTNGTDLEAIYSQIKAGILKNVKIALVCANKDCPAAQKAKSWGLHTIILPSKGVDRLAYDKKLHALLEPLKIDLVVLVGYMRIFSPWFVKEYAHKIINIHPSLLPSFPGMDLDVHKEVLDYGCKVTGCTVHFVDEGTDTGPIIAQEVVSVAFDDTPESLKAKVHAKEKELYPRVIEWFSKGNVHLQARKVNILS